MRPKKIFFHKTSHTALRLSKAELQTLAKAFVTLAPPPTPRMLAAAKLAKTWFANSVPLTGEAYNALVETRKASASSVSTIPGML